MPIYEYKCAACGLTFEELSASAEADRPRACPDCGHAGVDRQHSVFAAHGVPNRPTPPPSCGQCCRPDGTCPMAEA